MTIPKNFLILTLLNPLFTIAQNDQQKVIIGIRTMREDFNA
jgi:hypothetical protein